MQIPRMQEFYERIIATPRSGAPTIREARTDYLRTVRQIDLMTRP